MATHAAPSVSHFAVEDFSKMAAIPSLSNETSLERSRLALARPDLLRERAFVAGEWVGSEATSPVANPATLRVLGCVPQLSASEVSYVIEAAEGALEPWRSRTAKDRSGVLRR